METFRIKKDDTKPYLAVTLQSSDGTAVDLTDSAVKFNLGDSNFSNVHSGVATITDASAGQCEYRWEAAATAAKGDYFGEFEITFSDATIMTLPNDHSLKVEIYEDYD